MINVLRVVGLLMIGVGLLLAASWFIEPLRQVWPMLMDLPPPIRIGLIVAAIGLLVVFGTVIHDRIKSDPNSVRENLGDDP